MQDKSRVMYSGFLGMDRRSRINANRRYMYDIMNMFVDKDGNLKKISGTRRVSWRHGAEDKVRFDTGGSDYIDEFGGLSLHKDQATNTIAFGRVAGEYFPFIYKYNRNGVATPEFNSDRIDWEKYAFPATFPLLSNGGLPSVPTSWLDYLRSPNFTVENRVGYYDVATDAFVDVEKVSGVNEDYYTTNSGDPALYVPIRGNYIEEHLNRMWLCGVDSHANVLLHTQPYTNNFYQVLEGVPVLLEVRVGADGSLAGNIYDKLTACRELHETLYIFKQNSIHRLIGTSVATFDTQVISKEVGLEYPSTLVSSEYGLFFMWKPEKGIYNMVSGNRIDNISGPVQSILDGVPVDAEFSGSILGDLYIISWNDESLAYNMATQSWSRFNFKVVSATSERFARFCLDRDVLEFGTSQTWLLDPDGSGGEELDILFETIDDSCAEEHSAEKDFFAYNMFYKCPDRDIQLEVGIDGRRGSIRPSNVASYPINNQEYDGFKMEDLPTVNAVFMCPMISGYTVRAKCEHSTKHGFELARLLLFYDPVNLPLKIGVQK